MSLNIHINSPNVKYTDTHITAHYYYQTASVHRDANDITVSNPFLHLYNILLIWDKPVVMHSNVCRFGKQITPRTTEMTFRTERRVPRLGVMLVGWGGNNGTTVTAAVLANSLGLTWRTKTGVKVGRGTEF